MASLASPQSSAGVLSFYDAPTNGPKINPKFVLVTIIVVAVIILAVNHFVIYA
ncbi:preprotein translocase subunit Sec61beta [Candidatus Mancarchaeum acidiphilum]|uniref:Preprotein translocase subunit Sec61beta n=1 Tax=Candidatus Mancarchaeum acidiphilum TaxID=1920749 RepID=A0A218NNJ3_9ARCH|nr:preprotein translocase subunit Sec61beta [Candidatus Mancarchaeum acidiphilum]ASI14024.1 preprotein translocase subunit Sec61beta [Candidatus Mancarchaeum acidiphilum]